MFDKPLGKLTLADVLDEEGVLEYNQWTWSQEIVYKTRIGPSVFCTYFHFGVLSNFFSHLIYESEFEWDHENNKAKTPPENILINWVGISQGSDNVCFEWRL
jgi:hypothetical protein